MQVEQISEALREQVQEQLVRQIQVAQESHLLLYSQVLERFFRDVEERAFQKADGLPLSDTAGRDRAYFIVHLSRKFKKALEQYIQTGELAEAQLSELLEDKKKKSLLGGLLG